MAQITTNDASNCLQVRKYTLDVLRYPPQYFTTKPLKTGVSKGLVAKY
jgi:hypothetical protein